jgi:hypothetical protein
MAKEEHLARPQQGVDAWNRWQDETNELRPDFSDAHLRGPNPTSVSPGAIRRRGRPNPLALLY